MRWRFRVFARLAERESFRCVQFAADKIKCSAERPGALFHSVKFTVHYVRSVGLDVSPGKCVLLSTSKSVRNAMKL